MKISVHTKIVGGDDVLNCTFAGHREVLEPSIHNLLVDALEKIARKNNEITFYTGGMGEFDAMCGAAVRQLKRHFPEKKICLYLVCPYMTTSINRDAYYLKEQYDDVLIPSELMGCHYKSAITQRNRWLVDHSDTIITYVKRDYGGACTTKKYAERKGLIVINLWSE